MCATAHGWRAGPRGGSWCRNGLGIGGGRWRRRTERRVRRGCRTGALRRRDVDEAAVMPSMPGHGMAGRRRARDVGGTLECQTTSCWTLPGLGRVVWHSAPLGGVRQVPDVSRGERRGCAK